MKPEEITGSDLKCTTSETLNTDYKQIGEIPMLYGGEDEVSSSSSPSLQTVQDEMSLIKTCDFRVVPKEQLTLVYNINRSTSPSSPSSSSNQEESDLDWDDSTSWKFIFRFNSQQTEINKNSNIPIPQYLAESLHQESINPQSPSPSPKISYQIHNQGETSEPVTTDIEQNKYIFPQRTLLVIHPFLTLHSGDTAVNCYLPKKSRKLSCVTVKRDPIEPVSVSVNLNADISILDLVEELSTERGMSSGSSNLHTLKSSDVANGHIFQSYQSSNSSSPQNTFNLSNYHNTTRTTTNNSNQHSLTTNFSPAQVFRSPSSTPPTIKQQEIKILKVEQALPTIFASNTVIIQTGSQSQLITPGILTTNTTATILKSNSIPIQIQSTSPKVIMGTTNSKSKVTKPETPTETQIRSRPNIVTIQAKNTEQNIQSTQQQQQQKTYGVTIQSRQNHDSSLLPKTYTNEGDKFISFVICQQCGLQSKNRQVCEHCKRCIPKDTKVIAMPISKQGSFQNYKIPKKGNSKRAPSKSRILEISLSSDEDEASPGKKQKKSENQNNNNNNADQNLETSFSPASPTEVITTTGTATPTQGKICQEKIGSLNNSNATTTTTTTIGTSGVKKMEDLPICSLQTETSSNADKDLKIVKEKIQRLLSMEESITATLDCNIIRVGSYQLSMDDSNHRQEDWQVHFTKEGILFKMVPCSSSGRLMVLAVPHAAIVGTSVSFNVRQPSFIVIKPGHKVVNIIRTSLGMKQGTYWFDPGSPVPAARNIIFVTEKLTEVQLKNIRQIYDTTFTEFDYANALIFRQEIGLKFEGDDSDLEFRKSSAAITKLTTKTTTIVPASGKLTNSRPQSAVIKTPVNNGQSSTGLIKTVIPTPVIPGSCGYIGENKKIFTWPKGTGIALSQADIFTLKGEQFLNDQIIDFWLTYVLHKLNKEDRERTHVFSTFFYTRLTQKPTRKHCPAFETDKKLTAAEKRHLRVKKWTKKVDIFSKDFVIVPIVDSCHWYLAIICYPGLSGPHWANDNTPIESWKNVGIQNKRPIYQPPPGMPPNLKNFKSKKSKPCIADESSTNSLAKSTSSTPTTPSSSSLELSGNPTKINPSTQSCDLDNKKPPTIIPLSYSPSEDKDEEEDDPDENALFDDFYSSDTDDSTTTGESKKTSSNGGDSSTVQSTAAPTSSLPQDNVNEDNQSDSNNQDVDMKPDVASCDIKPKPEPMDIDDPQNIKTENLQGGRTDFRVKQPCIIIFDSLSGTSRSRVFNTLREYLRLEYKERKGGEERSFTKFDMPGFMPNVPQQKNLYDCGLYLLQYAEHFFSNPLSSFCLPVTELKKWFPLLKLKRKEIYDTIYKLVETESKDTLPLMPKFDTAALTSVTTSIQDSIQAALSAASSASQASSSLAARPKIEKISAVQVESAPRQVLTPVKPSEEPMDVDVVSTTK